MDCRQTNKIPKLTAKSFRIMSSASTPTFNLEYLFRSRKANFSEASTKLNESDDSETGGFVFHQIGILEFWGDEAEDFRCYEDAARGFWLPTELCAVIRFGRTGTANGVYIIYDFYPTDDFGERGLETDGDNWGQLPEDHSNQQFSIAKNR
jgi:hypothetical protein